MVPKEILLLRIYRRAANLSMDAFAFSLYLAFMLTVPQIKKPIATELEEFEVRFRESMKSNEDLLDKITHYIVQR